LEECDIDGGTVLRSLLGLIAPSLARRRRRPKRREQLAQRVSSSNFAPSGGEGSSGPKVLVANLVGDRGGAVTDQLSAVLDRCDILQIYRANKELRPSKDTNVVRRLLAANDEGRGWLTAQGVDILVWGECEGENIVLRFVLAQPCADGLPGAFGLGDTLELPLAQMAALEPAVHTTVLAAVGPTFNGMKSRLAEALGQTMQGARDLAQAQPDGVNEAQHATILTALGSAFATQYRLTKNTKNLESAIAVYKNAVARLKPERNADIWAVAQGHLATAMKARGTIEKNDDALKEAAVAYQKITETLGRDTHPFDWALAHINHGLVLYRLSMRTGRAAYLQEAGKAFEEALTVYTKEAMPARWAEVMNQYGVNLLALGEQVTGNTTLEMAVKKFRKVLEVRKRERAPQLWAQTANNLGAACFSLAKRNAEVALLREAMGCFEGAAEVYEQSGARQRAEVIKSNLQRVQRLLTARAS
jgi:tetratricopeptide (TPR) repeat protein